MVKQHKDKVEAFWNMVDKKQKAEAKSKTKKQRRGIKIKGSRYDNSHKALAKLIKDRKEYGRVSTVNLQPSFSIPSIDRWRRETTTYTTPDKAEMVTQYTYNDISEKKKALYRGTLSTENKKESKPSVTQLLATVPPGEIATDDIPKEEKTIEQERATLDSIIDTMHEIQIGRGLEC